MITGGNVTIRVSDMDAAVRFYTATLGLKLTHRFGNSWATIEAGASYWTTDEVGAGLVIGLRQRSSDDPPAGTRGSVMFGLETYEPIEKVASDLGGQGVRQAEITRTEIGNFLSIEDMDGNAIYLWEIVPEMLSDEDNGKVEASDVLGTGLFAGGHANIYVSDMDRAVSFYTKVLGLPLTNRFGNKWATVEAGRSLVIGIHPQTPHYPPPGTKGSTVLGLTLDEPIDRVMARLAKHGVRMAGSVTNAEQGRAASIEDPDGNVIELHEPATTTSEEAVLSAEARH